MNCFVIGNGGWGTALGMVLAGNGHSVTIWGPFEKEVETIRQTGENSVYLAGVALPSSMNWTSDPTEASNADLVVVVTPSRFYRSSLETFKPYLRPDVPIVSATKGLDETTHQRMSEVAAEVLGRDIAILSGPSHAEEVARGIPTAVTVAGQNIPCLEKIQTAFMG
ncbi:MAG: hypothetical protein OEL75_01240, partial [Kiritimatiellaceae bacterium]|nr:hypothetical protein [Kiritimatiellaceae bacterium]